MILIAALLMAAPAQPMTAGEFLARAEPLFKKSMVSLMFSAEARRLMRTVGEAAQHTRAKADADRAAGRSPTACLPPKGKAKVNATELMAYLRALPPAQRSQSFDQAFGGYAARKYPCR